MLAIRLPRLSSGESRAVHLPRPSPEEFRAVRRDAEVQAEANRLRTILAHTVRNIEPESLLALARHRSPGATDHEAMGKFVREVTALLQELVVHGNDARAALAADQERLKPTFSKAASRHFEVVRNLTQIDAEISRHESDMQKRRKNLAAAGVKGDDLERLAPVVGPTALLEKQTALRLENEALLRFLSTYDERHLPDGFTVAAGSVLAAVA